MSDIIDDLQDWIVEVPEVDPQQAQESFAAFRARFPELFNEQLGVLEPPQDFRIFNRRQADGSLRSISEFFDR